MSNKFDMSDYVPVNERVESFIKAYPEGSIQSEIVELTGSRVTVKAFAYRTPADPRPGVGHSSLEIPGSTPYTRGSEIENAETSAWGRAIAALGFEVKRGIASSEEVRNKTPQAGSAPPAAATRPVAVVQSPPAAATAPDEVYEDASALFDADEIAAAVSGERLPDKPPYVVKAEQKAAAQRSGGDECPEHGSIKVKENKRGLYCATKLADGTWCPWSKAKAA